MSAVTFTNVENTQFTVNWSALSDASAGYSTITAYKLYKTNNSGTIESLLYTGTDNSFDYSGLTGGTTYYFVVTATNLYGTSANSSVGSQVASQVPDQMASPGIAVTGTNIVFTLTAPSSNNAAIDYYEVYFLKTDNTFVEVTGCIDPTTTSCTVAMADAVSATSKSANDIIAV